MLKINYEVKKIKNPNSGDREALTGGRLIDEGFDDTAYFVCAVLQDMLRDLKDVMDPDDYEKVYNIVKRGEIFD